MACLARPRGPPSITARMRCRPAQHTRGRSLHSPGVHPSIPPAEGLERRHACRTSWGVSGGSRSSSPVT
eukprot:8871313-Alexandrium_andersonii.AAC.1